MSGNAIRLLAILIMFIGGICFWSYGGPLNKAKLRRDWIITGIGAVIILVGAYVEWMAWHGPWADPPAP